MANSEDNLRAELAQLQAENVRLKALRSVKASEPADDEFICADLFCGGGGTSEALKQAAAAMGIPYKLYAVNHWSTAIDTHEVNHPEAKHACAGVGDVDPLKFVPEGRLDLLMASPECIFYSSARGGKPVNDQRRSTAWDVVDIWVPALKPKQLLIENVPEFMNWGDLYPSDYHIAKLRDRPNPKFKGRIFEEYIGKLKKDYRIEVSWPNSWRGLRRCHYSQAPIHHGVAQGPEGEGHHVAGADALEDGRQGAEEVARGPGDHRLVAQGRIDLQP